MAPASGLAEFSGIDFAQLETTMRKGGETELAKLSKDELGSEVAVHALVRIGAPAVQIIETARALSVDLIVISTHGRRGLKHVLLGSVAERIVQRAPCPVFVVREHEHEIPAS